MNDSGLPAAHNHRDVIVIGASAGGIEALQVLLGDLPPDLRAAIFIVMHLGATSHLAQILDRATSLPVVQARSGEPIVFGQVCVAVPGVHLLLHDNHLLLRRGPRENLARPAIDPLFRSAACSFGSRVIGVVLSGGLNDGTAGLRAIKHCGGLSIVQDPSDAAVPQMPLSALRYADIDYVTPIAAMGDLLTRLTHEPAGETPPIPPEIKFETMIAAQELAGMAVEDVLGRVSRFTCPECHGALWEIDDGRLLRFRCHVGHAYTADVMLAAQSVRAEEMLWSLMRAHQERAELARRMAQQDRVQGREALAVELEQRAESYDEDATVLRDLLRTYHAANGTEAAERDSL
jgi:two-component system, chemotaxis family, protein-glutamate methylesterase/glutaminase